MYDLNARPVCLAVASSIIREQCRHSSQVNWCLGVELDSDLNWNTQKLNLLRSLYFLPISARADFYFEVKTGGSSKFAFRLCMVTASTQKNKCQPLSGLKE